MDPCVPFTLAEADRGGDHGQDRRHRFRAFYPVFAQLNNIPYEEMIDDSAFSLNNNSGIDKSTLYVRLRFLKKVDTPLLHLNFLREYGLRSSMQSAFTVSGELLDYIETKFL